MLRYHEEELESSIINSCLNSVIEAHDVRKTIGYLTITNIKRNIKSFRKSSGYDSKIEVTNKSYENS